MIDPCVMAAYESVKARAPLLPLNDFVEALAECEVFPVVVRGKAAGAIIVKGCEVHACVESWAAGHWFGRRAAKVLNAVIQKCGYARTSATTDAGRAFVERLGFVACADGYRKETPWALRR